MYFHPGLLCFSSYNSILFSQVQPKPVSEETEHALHQQDESGLNSKDPRSLLKNTFLGGKIDLHLCMLCWLALGCCSSRFLLNSYQCHVLSLGSRKRKLPPEETETMAEDIDRENSSKRSKHVPKLYCTVCNESLYSKNMARHRKSRRHIYLEQTNVRDSSTKSHGRVEIIKVPSSILSCFVPPNKLELFKAALFREGYFLEET